MDIRCKTFSGLLATKKNHYPYSDRYIAEVHDSSTKTGRTEREHMVEWFRFNETKGVRFVFAREPEQKRPSLLQQPYECGVAALDR